ncbi:MAG: phosphoribosylformylglycinamidine synthase [Oscillospiraceae bacterium]|nr:phosphoribosylformylglycinamidine synthase [Oscillospiraceae bacterium]
MQIFSYYTEKKPAYAVEPAALLADLHVTAGIKSVTGLRLVNRYFIEGLTKEQFDAVKAAVFSDPVTENTWDALPDFGGARVFAAELLPVQFDQTADLCAQCIALMTGGARPQVRCTRPVVRRAQVYALEGDISDDDFAAVKAWVINTADSRETPLEVPDTLAFEYTEADDVGLLDGFTELDEAGLKAELSRLGLAMDLADLAFCRDYFRDGEKRDPTVTEIRMIDTYWSDHCRHTTFLTELDNIEIADGEIKDSYKRYLDLRAELNRGDRPVTLMDMATIGARVLKARGVLTDLEESEEVNACSVKIKAVVDGKEQDWLLMFKNETHNHPTEIEPFGGAATCLGGGIRDPLSGRGYVYQAMRITGAGDPRVTAADTLPGKLPQRKICTTAAAGYSSYGNQVGAASGLVHEIYHPGYTAKRMELGALVAAAPAENVTRGKPVPGDVVILLGGKTGRDGCGGATGSSKSHTAEFLEDGGPKGNAPEERKIIRLFRDPKASKLIKRCNDFGAGGVSVAIGELADGLDIDLDKVPAKYGGLDGTELAISESQERMAVVVATDDAEKFIGLADAENLDAVVVAAVKADPRVTIKWRGKTIVSLARSFLSSNGAAKHTSVKISSPDTSTVSCPEPDAEALTELMGDLQFCSQKGLIERFDYSAGAGTMLAPLGGKYQLTPSQVMAARLPARGKVSSTCSLMSWGFDPFISEKSPYHGARNAVIHSIAKIIAAGGSRAKCWLTFQEYFERLRDEPTRWGKPAAALLGALDAQIGLNCGAVGGKDSMSGSFEDIDVPPTLVSFAVSAADAENIVSTHFKQAGSRVYLLRPGFTAFGKADFDELRGLFDKAEKLIADGKVKSAWAIGQGGTAEAVLKMCFGNRIGFTAAKALTSEPVFGGFVIEADELPGFDEFLIGGTTEDYALILHGGGRVDMQKLQSAWESTLEDVYPSKADQVCESEKFSFNGKSAAVAAARTAQPCFVIPVFPGTNSEYDIEHAVETAGAKAQIIVVRNRNERDIAESAAALEKEVSAAQGIILPGGDISAGFIVPMFKNGAVKEAVEALLQNRDGLICGIGGGFAALLRLGLLPYGRFTDTAEYTLAGNKIGRHQAVTAKIRIVSRLSPWLGGFKQGECVMLPVSTEKGRFTTDEKLIRALAENGQAATQFEGTNPTGSDFAIEGVTSPDGRIFGRIAHGERISDGVLVNIPGSRGADIFEGAVGYFR